MPTESADIKLTDSELVEASTAYKNVTNIDAQPVKPYIEQMKKIDQAVYDEVQAELNKKTGGKVARKSRVKSRSRSRSKSRSKSKSKSKSKPKR